MDKFRQIQLFTMQLLLIKLLSICFSMLFHNLDSNLPKTDLNIIQSIKYTLLTF